MYREKIELLRYNGIRPLRHCYVILILQSKNRATSDEPQKQQITILWWQPVFFERPPSSKVPLGSTRADNGFVEELSLQSSSRSLKDTSSSSTVVAVPVFLGADSTSCSQSSTSFSSSSSVG